MADDGGGGVVAEPQWAADLTRMQEAELEHFTLKCIALAMQMLASNAAFYLDGENLELGLAARGTQREMDRPKWLTQDQADDVYRPAAARARAKFRAETRIGGDTGAGVAGNGAAAELPIINRHNQRLRDLVSEGIAALAAWNRRGITVFQRSGVLVRLKREDGIARIEILDADSLGLMLDRAADWIVNKGDYPRAAEPPERVVRSMLKLAGYDFPTLRGVAHAPFFNAAGLLVNSPDYDSASRIFLDPVGLDALDPVPARPSADEVRIALGYLKDELLGNFPFATLADRANAIGLLLTPFLRAMIDGPVPLHVIDSPQVGTGKSLLASVAHIVATGRAAPTGVERFEQAEAHKAITALLLEAPPFILLDNVDRRIMSGAFAAVLTAEQWTDRVLGQSKMVTVENRAIWVATGNNLTLSGELRRRAVEVRLDAQMERPEERTGFRHPDLKAWTRENRPALVYACLLLTKNWIVLGRPAAPGRPLASFASWSNIVGGVLAAAQVEGFLANADIFRERADPDAKNWRRFVEEWTAAHVSNAVTVEVLAPIARGLMPELLGSGNEISQHSKLGRALRQRCGQIIAGWRIEAAECRDAEGRARSGYRLARASAQEG